MILKELIQKAAEYLSERHIEDPSKEAGLLLSYVLGKDISFIYANQELILTDRQHQSFWAAVKRRGAHEPYAYITGRCEFLSLSFEVNPEVLIPRPDTELLAEAALIALGKDIPFYKNKNLFRLPQKSSYRVLDIGTGSGCIAVSIAKYAPSARVDAVDISEGSLETAKRNAQYHNVSDRINFIRADFLKDTLTPCEGYDLIVSNPPYIKAADIPELMASVRDYEPHAALDGGEDGLLFYRALAEKADSILSSRGIIAVECGFDQASEVEEIFRQQGMKTLSLKDLSYISRVLEMKKE